MNFQLQIRRCRVGGSASAISRTSMSCPATSVASSKFLIAGAVRTGTRTDMATEAGIQNGNGPHASRMLLMSAQDGGDGLDGIMRFMCYNADKDREDGYK